jgi:protein-S-isoprenylcysteine O-methyltransferase Ste14
MCLFILWLKEINLWMVELAAPPCDNRVWYVTKERSAIEMVISGWYLVCWGTVIVVWQLGALYNAFFGPQVVERRWWGSQALETLVGLGLFVLAQRFLPINFWAPITLQSVWLWTAGLIILAFSTTFILWARWVLGTLWTSTAVVKQGHQLRTTGPYRITRHPIYTGFLGMTFGTTLMNGFGMMLPVFLILFVFFEFKIRSEEALLTKTFGDQYLKYKQRVPQLLPGLMLNRVK